MKMGQVTCPHCCGLTTLGPSHSSLSHTRFGTRRGRTRTPSLGLRACARYVLFAVFLLHSLTSGDALEAHISSTDPGGILVFNASLGSGWSYQVDLSQSQAALPFLELDSSTGLVYWRGGRDQCSLLKHNPIDFHIVSRTWQWPSLSGSNITSVPYSVYVHGCIPQSHRTEKFQRLKGESVHQIILSSRVEASECIPPMTSLMKITDFLPHSLRQCQIFVDLPASSPVAVDDGLVLTSDVKMCFIHDSVSTDFFVSVLCDHSQLFQVPFKLRIESQPPHLPAAHRRRRRAANNQPRFDPSVYVQNVKEEQLPGLLVVTITATDTDTEGAGTLTYSMIPTRDERSQNMFAINPITGTVNTTVRLDREDMRAHYFRITATDHGVPPKSGTASLSIIVDDVNDHAPQFGEQNNDISISENQAVGEPILSVQATDQDFLDNAIIRYSILNSASPNDAFLIDPTSGAISTMRELDRETHQHYQLLVMAVDQAELGKRKSSTATVNITITDENDNSPTFSEESYSVSIPENKTVSNTVPIIRITATDRDIGENANIIYQLSGNNEKFSVNANTGEVFLVGPLDYEENREFHLTLRAEDQGTPSRRGTTTLLVHVIDVNDNAPFFTSTRYTATVVEDSGIGTSIVQVQAFDRDSDQNSLLTYSFVSVPDNQSLPLDIDSQTGWIRTSGQIDREHRPEYGLVVRAMDNGSPQLSATTSVAISVRDINDNAPIFTSRHYQATVSEEARIGDEVIRVVAEDGDEGENARVHYTIISGNIGDVFQMSQSNNEGLITVKKELDARQQNRYSLSVTATDTGGRQDTVQVDINVTDTNRHAPVFQATPFQFSVDENIPIGTSVFKVMASDRDRGENALITYSLDPGEQAFSIDPNTGDIFTRVALNREMAPAYMLRVIAIDNGRPQRQDVEDIDVTVNDENDNRPEFRETNYTGSISEDALPGESVLQISAADFDKDANGQVFYTFEGGNDGSGHFSIDSALGIIRVADYLDRERVANYELVALAVDRGTPPLSSSVIIRIRVIDENDNHPSFEADELNVYITENSPIGSTVAQITATDPDEGVNALVEYSFDGGPDVDSFELTGRRGDPAIITTRIPLDYESDKKRYEIILRAASQTQFSTATVLINVRDVNDNAPQLRDFSIIYNNYGGSFPRESIGRIPAFDPDVSDQELLTYRIESGNEAGLLHLNNSTGMITLDSRLNSDVPRNGTFRVSVSGKRLTW